jgi:peptide/nickel transport system substrate-binding protein
LVFGSEAVGADYAPAHTFQGWGHETARLHIYDTLYGYPNGDVTKPITPLLAAGPPRRDRANPRHYIVPLRRNVTFHDGTPFDADAVVFNFKRYLDNQHPQYDSGALFRGTYFMAGVYDVEKIDRYTVKFLTNRPLGDFPAQLVAFAGIASPTAVRNEGVQNYGLRPVGTGPMRFVEAVRGDRVELAAFDRYWGGRPTISRLIIRAIPDGSALTAALLAGEVDMSWFVSNDDVAVFQRDSRFNTAFRPSTVTGYMGFNAGGSAGSKVFTNLRVRQAALYALDERKLINVALRGYAIPGAGVNPVSSWGYQKELRNFYKHNPARARDLLRAAGDVPTVRLWAQSSGFWPRMAESIQADWNAVGLRTEIQSVDSAAFYGLVTQGRHDVFIGDGTPLLFAPFIFYQLFFGCTNPLRGRVGGWCDTRFDSRVRALVAQRERKKAVALIEQLDRTLLGQAIWKPLYYPTLVSVWNKNVTGFTPPSSRSSLLSKLRVAS